MKELLKTLKDNKRNLASIAAAGIVAASTSGCASIFFGSKHTIEVGCNERDATITVDGRCVSPGVVEANRQWKDNIVTYSKPGYTTDTQRVRSSINPAILLNGFLWWFAPLGLIVDLGTGAYVCYDKNDRFYGNIYPIQPARKEKPRKEENELMGKLYTGD